MHRMVTWGGVRRRRNPYARRRVYRPRSNLRRHRTKYNAYYKFKRRGNNPPSAMTKYGRGYYNKWKGFAIKKRKAARLARKLTEAFMAVRGRPWLLRSLIKD